MRRYNIAILLLFLTNITFAQIGYQVSLLNSATGQPRAGETVTVDVKLINSENATVYTTQQKATSNDFGVLSLSVGDANTFDELDWNKLPLYIEVSIDGVLIAKSQVLSVPVAEYAKKSGFVLTKEFLASKSWISRDGVCVLNFSMDGACEYKERYKPNSGEIVWYTSSGNYIVDGSDLIMYISLEWYSSEIYTIVLKYIPMKEHLIGYDDDYTIFE